MAGISAQTSNDLKNAKNDLIAKLVQKTADDSILWETKPAKDFAGVVYRAQHGMTELLVLNEADFDSSPLLKILAEKTIEIIWVYSLKEAILEQVRRLHDKKVEAEEKELKNNTAILKKITSSLE